MVRALPIVLSKYGEMGDIRLECLFEIPPRVAGHILVCCSRVEGPAFLQKLLTEVTESITNSVEVGLVVGEIWMEGIGYFEEKGRKVDGGFPGGFGQFDFSCPSFLASGTNFEVVEWCRTKDVENNG
jgi:hypothetical protein